MAGQTTETFRRHPMPALARASFSLVYADAESAGALRTLDLTCQSELEHELWFWGLQVGLGVRVQGLGLLSDTPLLPGLRLLLCLCTSQVPPCCVSSCTILLILLMLGRRESPV